MVPENSKIPTGEVISVERFCRCRTTSKVGNQGIEECLSEIHCSRESICGTIERLPLSKQASTNWQETARQSDRFHVLENHYEPIFRRNCRTYTTLLVILSIAKNMLVYVASIKSSFSTSSEEKSSFSTSSEERRNKIAMTSGSWVELDRVWV